MSYKPIYTLQELQTYLHNAPLVAFDFETAPDEPYRTQEKSALDAHKSHIVGISFSIADGSGVYLPIAHRVGKNAEEIDDIWKWLDEFFTDPSITKIAHNLAFESQFLYARGMVVQEPCYDTIAAAQLVYKGESDRFHPPGFVSFAGSTPAISSQTKPEPIPPNRKSYEKEFRTLAECGLKTLVAEYFNEQLPSYGETVGKRHFDELDPQDEKTVRYSCSDADYALRLYHLLNGWFDRFLPKHSMIVEQIESPTAVYVGIMRYNGLPIDRNLMEQKREQARKKLVELKGKIAFIIGDINIGANASTAAFKRYLFDTLGLPKMKLTAKEQNALDDEAIILLKEWCGRNRPELVELFDLVQEYRHWGKIKSTYIDGYLKYVNHATGRIHPDLLPLATETGRFASKNPNCCVQFNGQKPH